VTPRLRAVLGSLVFLVVAPGVAAGLVPWALTGWDVATTWLPLQVVGAAMVVAGGLYRFVRNPMYLAVASTIAGQALILGRPGLLAYAAAFLVVVVAFVRGYEEPTLAARYGGRDEEYRQAVPGWWPRRRPWRG
jgi:protein-S-isoprenylcysteine O-methyltransferase Ste14